MYERQVDEQMYRWMDKQMNIWMDAWDGWTDGMDRWVCGWMHGWMHVCVHAWSQLISCLIMLNLQYLHCPPGIKVWTHHQILSIVAW